MGSSHEELVSHVRSLHSTKARAYVRQLDDIEALTALNGEKLRSTVREAVTGRLYRLRRERSSHVWKPTEPDAVIRDTIVAGKLYTCPCCERSLAIGDGLDEIGVRRKRNLVRGGVEYVIRPQSYCHRCQRDYPHKRKERP